MQIVNHRPQESNAMIRQDGKPMPLDPIEPESPASRAQARDAQEIQRAEGLAHLLASFEDIHDLWSQPEHRSRNTTWGSTASSRGEIRQR